MSTLSTVPEGITTFKPYDKPRYSKAKRYKRIRLPLYMSQLCCNCHQPFEEHIRYYDYKCPEYQILNK